MVIWDWRSDRSAISSETVCRRLLLESSGGDCWFEEGAGELGTIGGGGGLGEAAPGVRFARSFGVDFSSRASRELSSRLKLVRTKGTVRASLIVKLGDEGAMDEETTAFALAFCRWASWNGRGVNSDSAMRRRRGGDGQVSLLELPWPSVPRLLQRPTSSRRRSRTKG